MVALGVDFGTSHTVAVARWPDGRARPLLFDGSPLLPSAVSLEETGLIVGRDAVHSARRAPQSFEPNPKRRIDDGSVLLGEQDVPVQGMMTAVFERVLAEFTRTAGGAPSAVTVTHPAGWASTRRKTLQDAVRQAGLPGAALVPEPVAAATYFVRALRNMVPVGSAVVVYDLGAGTFDGSVVARTQAGFEVLAVGGRDDLGGLDFDEVVIGLIGRALPAADWQRVTADARAGRQLREEAREAKERLSRAASATVMVPLLDVDVPLTRDEFEAAARPLVERSVRSLAETLRLSRLTPERTAGIFLVGGASRMPLIATELHREFGRPPVTIEQPELVVAEGSVLVGAAVPTTRSGRAVAETPAPASPAPSSFSPAPSSFSPTPSAFSPAPSSFSPSPPGVPPTLPGIAPTSPGVSSTLPGVSPVAPTASNSLALPADSTLASGASGPGSVAPGSVAPGSVAPGPVGPGPVGPGPVGPGPVGPGPVGPGPAAEPSSPAARPAVPGSPVSPGPVAPVPISPPVQRRPPVPPPPAMPRYPAPYPPRPLYYPPPTPQVVYYPAYAMPAMMVPQPRVKGPWSIRWPAGFMTTYAVLLYFLAALLLLAATLPYLSSNGTPTFEGQDLRDLTRPALEVSGLCAVLATLLVHAAARARRPMARHLWYPLALCLIVGLANLVFSGQGGGLWTQIPAGVFLLSAAMLLLPGSRKWARRPRKPPALKPPEPDPGPPQSTAG
ncbi:Hsp70 family protein [Dactylosporangium sp. CA-092794]|uniref:Hsp70 family protein n=1 Tax=Dactylosporangium sp. CA-092794 TaxID=3239929 RepID=UPI003D90F32C